MSFLFNIPYLPYFLAALALLLAYRALAARVKIRLPGVPLSKDELLGKILGSRYNEAKLEKTVARERKQANWLAAGKLYEDAGKLAEAAETYLEGSEFYAAAATFEKMGRIERSAELYLQAGDYKKSAQLFVQAGHPAKAAHLFLEKGNTMEAARLFAQAQDWAKAAELYAKGGYPLRAAEAYEKKGEWIKAAEAYEKHFMENVSYSTTYSSTAATTDQKSARHAGRLYEKGGDLQHALNIFFRGQYFAEAGAVSMQLGQFDKAAELFMRAEDPARAADAYEQGGDRVKAANLRGEVALKQEQIPEAARFFQQGEDFLRAAELFESKGMLAEAAGAYEAGDSYAAAGNVYVRAGLKERAAAAYERAGELETAAKLYEEAGNGRKAMELYSRAGLTFKSGETAARAGEREKAIALLQRVPASDENYRAATELLAELFLQSQMPTLAIERVQKAIGGQTITSANIDLYYWLALGYEAAGNIRDALATHKKVLAEDLQFRDAGERASRLEAALSHGAAEAPTAARAVTPPEVSVQVCPTCGLCYDHQTESCARDRSRLMKPRVVPYVLLDRYRLIRVLGEGGMGLVFEAEDQRLQRKVAIKIVNAEELRDPDMKARLEREARAVARIHHPGVVAIYDSGELQDGSAFLVMELLEGSDLASLIKSHGPGRPDQVASLLRQAGAAVAAAHQVKVIHRDIKPQNIFMFNGPEGIQLKVLDFGVAKTTTVDTAMTRTGMIVGTPAYMPPEQVQGTDVDARGDLYSLAVVGFEALTGQRLVPEGPLMKVLFTVTHTPAPRLLKLLPTVSPEVDEAFAKALSKDPAARPPDVLAWIASFYDAMKRMPATTKGWPEPLPPVEARDRPLLRASGISAAPPVSPVAPAAPTTVPPAAPPRPAPPTLVPQPSVAPAAQPASASAGTVPHPPSVVSPAASAGAKPQRFVPHEEIGRGPLGVVHRAEDRVDGRAVALRFLPADLLRNPATQGFVADLKASAQLSHPNLVKVLGLVEVSGQRCVVTEHVSGRNFAEALKLGHKLPFPQVHGMGRILAQVLSVIHGKGLLHGTIQPSNVMVASGVVKVTDLGFGRLAAAIPRGMDYLAPERKLDVAGDIFAAGAVLYHLLAGIHPKSPPPGAALPLPSRLAQGVPEAFDKLVFRCLDPHADRRYATADDLLRDLNSMVRVG